jgi:hypothetical protein
MNLQIKDEQHEIYCDAENLQLLVCDTVSLSKWCLHLHGLSSTTGTESFTLKDEGASTVQNTGNHLPIDTASHSWMPASTFRFDVAFSCNSCTRYRTE